MKAYILFAILWLFLSVSCSDYTVEPITKNNEIPAMVTNVRFEPSPGGAKIMYNVPKDNNLLYIKAVYQLKSGVQREVKSSFYQDYLEIDGLSDVSPCKINLYSVSRSEKESKPVTVEVTPLTAPVQTAFESLKMKETFGGVWVSFENKTEANLVFTILVKDSTDTFIPIETMYTKRMKGDFLARGFDPSEKTFGVFVKDRWGNRSDTLYANLIPVFEQLLDKTKFKAIELPGNSHIPHIGANVNYMWDGKTGSAGGIIHHTKPGSGIPQWFNFDMGGSSVLSRFKFHHRSDGFQYSNGDVKTFEVWGSNDPDKDGGWGNWVLLGTFTSIKPSGSPIGTNTAEDTQFACVDGEGFDFPNGIPPVRYLRFKVLEVWGGVNYIYVAELTFWGGEMIK